MSKTYKVTPEFRSNNLHKRGGGYQVFVVYKNKATKVYDNVQYPHGYINKIKESTEYQRDEIVDIYYKEHD